MSFDTYALCSCGHFQRLPFADWRHLHASVCPSCGVDVNTWTKVVGQPVRVGKLFRSRVVLMDRSGAVLVNEETAA